MSKFYAGKNVLRSLTYGIVLVLMLGFVLSGCAAPAPPAPKAATATATSAPAKATSPAPTQASTVAPPTGSTDASKQGDRLVIASFSFANKSPFGWENTEGAQVLWAHAFDPFIIVDPKTMELKPGLLTEWKPSADYRVWTFKVRQGVMFHDNYGELTSEDIKFMFDKARDPKATSEMATSLFKKVEKIEAPDKYTLVMTMQSPDWTVPYSLDTYHNSMNIQPKKYLETVGEEKARLQPIGTGPYKFIEASGDAWRFQAIPNHWRVNPNFKELILRLMPEQSARLAALRSGEIDVTALGGDSLMQAKKAGFRIIEVPNVFQYWAMLPGQTFSDKGYPDYNPAWPWVGKPDPASQDNARKVRLALNLAVNKKAIIDNIWQGYGNDGSFVYEYSPENPGFSNEWKLSPYDPQKAKQLLVEAGYPNGFEITMLLANQAEDGPDVAEAISMDWEKIGLKVTRQRVEMMDLFGRMMGNKLGGSVVVANPPTDSQTMAWKGYFLAGGYFVAQSAEYNKAIQAMLDEPDTTKRNKLESAFGQKLYEENLAVRIGTKAMTWGVSKKVGDWLRLTKSNAFNFWEYITWSGQ